MTNIRFKKGARHYKCGPARKALQNKQSRLLKAKQIIENAKEEKKGDDVSFDDLKNAFNTHKKKNKRIIKGFWRKSFYYGFLLSLWGGVILSGFLLYLFFQLPKVDEILDEKRKPSITVLDKRGEKITSIDDLYGNTVNINEIPPHIWQSVVATEDRRFFNHFGIDLLGLARAFYYNFKAGRVVQGGSTITQQLAKNIFLSRERTIKRKIQEVMLALWLEHKFTKPQILSLYLNRVSLVGGKYGISAAADKLFNKEAKDLSLYEASVIAGMLKAPTRYNPMINKDASRKRAKIVLNCMVEEGYITKNDKEKAVNSYKYTIKKGYNQKRYFLDWVLEELNSRLGNIEEDIKLYTTLDLKIQNKAEALLTKYLNEDGKKAKAEEGAVLIMSDDGGIYAMVGGRDYVKSQYNRATQAKRQPGSVFKPIVYLAALEEGYTPTDVTYDEPITIANWTPRNYNDKYLGPVTLRAALARSLNTVPVRLAKEIGLSKVIKTAKKLGIGDEIRNDYSITLGSSEVRLIDLAAAYSVFANDGYSVLPYGIHKIVTKSGKVLYQRDYSKDYKLVKSEYVTYMNEMLSYVVSEGTGKRAFLGNGISHAGKTGTSQDSRDAWFIGYTSNIAGGVWVGNDNYTPMHNVYGGGIPAKIWKDLMLYIHTNIKPLNEEKLFGLYNQ